MPVRVSCPYCNTSFALPAVPANGRAACVRCGDSFPVRTFTEVDEVVAAPQAATARKARAKWSVARAVVVALVMGAVGVGVGLYAYHKRGDEPKQGEPDAAPAVVATAPASLSGLGFLPGDVNVAFAVQPGPVLAYAGRRTRNRGRCC